MSKDYLINERIKSDQILLIDGDINCGITSKKDALFKAREKELDLVQVGQDKYPVCKILDFGKFLYEQKKSKRKNKAKVVHRKEIQLRLSTAEQDLEMKIKKITELITEGCHVKTTIRLRGREHNFRSDAVNRIESICNRLNGRVEPGRIEHSTDTVSVILMPIKKGT